MATDDQIAQFRRMTGLSVDDEVYTDSYISNIIDQIGFETAAASVWREKAASVAGLVDMTESGSTRRLSQLYTQYLAMGNTLDPPTTDETTTGGSYTVEIERV
jgi:hypothetical protein